MREKLIELIGKVQDEGRDYSDVVCSYPTSNGRLADYLLANGVTIPVRCKDCVNYCGFEHCRNGICDVDSVSKRAVYPDDFCSYGERKDK